MFFGGLPDGGRRWTGEAVENQHDVGQEDPQNQTSDQGRALVSFDAQHFRSRVDDLENEDEESDWNQVLIKRRSSSLVFGQVVDDGVKNTGDKTTALTETADCFFFFCEIKHVFFLL